MAKSKEKLDNLLNYLVDSGVPGCGLSVGYKGKIVYTGYAGFADKESGKKVDADTVYTIASFTKCFTATAAMKLFEEGKFLLNDPVSEYLPEYKNLTYQTYDPSGETIVRPVSGPMTIKHLLTMTSGIPYCGKGSLTARDYLDKIGGMYNYPLRELAKKIAEIPLQFDPGTRWQYGFSYDVLAAVIEVITGKTYAEYLKEAVLDPLGLKNTAFVLTDAMQSNRATSYRIADGNATPMVRKQTAEDIERMKGGFGGGGLSSTLGDLTTLAAMWGNGGIWNGERILSRNTLELMSKNHLTGQAYRDFQLLAEEAYPWYRGYSWGLAGRTCVDLQEAGSNGSIGEFGWCGSSGPYLLGDPYKGVGAVFTMATMPVIGGYQDFTHPRVRNAVYSCLDEWSE